MAMIDRPAHQDSSERTPSSTCSMSHTSEHSPRPFAARQSTGAVSPDLAITPPNPAQNWAIGVRTPSLKVPPIRANIRQGSPYDETTQSSSAIIAAIRPSMEYAKPHMSMRLGNARRSARTGRYRARKAPVMRGSWFCARQAVGRTGGFGPTIGPNCARNLPQRDLLSRAGPGQDS
jgi:hypothetical protein